MHSQPGSAVHNVLGSRGAAPSIHTTRRTRIDALPTAATVCVLLAFMPFVGRADALSDATSASRVAELLLMTIATACGTALRGRPQRVPVPGMAAFCLVAVITIFSFWAMLTSLQGPLLLIGVVKALELLTLCFIAFRVVSEIRVSAPMDPNRIARMAVVSIVVVVTVLVLSDVILVGTPLPLENVTIVGAPLPLSTSNDWLNIGQRPRLLLGMNHPLASALLLAFGVIFCINTATTWMLKLPVILGLAWLLHLCDARGIEAGCVVGATLCLFRKLPRSPYKRLLAMFAIGAALFLAATVVLSGQLDDLIIRFAGSDAFTLNSRVDLWSYALALVPQNPLMGVGYVSTRFYLLGAFEFAGHAHNSAIEVLVSTGLIGASFFVMFLVLWVYTLVTTADPLLIGVSPLVLIEGSLNPILFTPGIGMFLMLLVLFNALFVTRGRAIPLRYRNEEILPDRSEDSS